MKVHTRGWAMGVAAVAGLFAFLLLNDWGKGDARELVRQQFHLPAEAEFTNLSVDNKNRLASPPEIQATVRFPDDSFRAYLERLNDPTVWKAQPVIYDGETFDSAWAADAYEWTNRSGNRELAWGAMSREAAQAASGGRLLCFRTYRRDAEERQQTPAASPCSAMTAAGAVVVVQGLIDPATRTLHVVIRGTR